MDGPNKLLLQNASPSPQISFGEEEPAVEEEDPEVGARFGNNNKQGGLLASVLGNIFFLALLCWY